EVGKGSEFVFSVTVGLDKKSMVPHASEELRDLNILAADDHPLVRKVLGNLGQSLHWHVTTLESGAQVLEELRRSRSEGRYYDYLLLDWHMPGMDGMETLKQAKTARDITLPLTLLMASAFELDRALAGEEYGDLDGVLAKPVTAAGLYEAISHVHAGEVLQFTPSPLKNAGRLQGMRLLVAEDNDMNQHVIEQILTRAGADVTIAANGFAAVEVLRADQGFDAVIMDVQMPVMDGYAATEAIRNELGLSELPIYALTAHASPHDRDLSRKAGMNGHIVKPIDVDLLFSMLRGRQAALSTDAAPAPPDEAEPAALPELDVAAGLRNFAGQKAKYYELLRGFAQGHGSDAELAFRLYREGDAGGAAKLVHDLCGMAAVLHAARLRSIASDLEKSLRAGAEAGAGFTPLREAMHDLLERIEDQVERPSV
ncbi:MAG TPA: response regulator, partial [Noviherbaspirillum sp.]